MPFNRIIRGLGWPEAAQGDIDYPAQRAPSETDFDALAALPVLFMAEGESPEQVARVGTLQVLTRSRTTIRLRYQYDLSVPPVPQDRLLPVATELGLSNSGRRFDWTHTHWSVEEGDLYRTMFRLTAAGQNAPTVFAVRAPRRIEQQVSVMMPFDASFTATYAAIVAAASECGLPCNRADDIWEHHTIIQDVVSLIDRSRIVVCDLSGKNANVFYETGIAHTLGREVILIARHESDVPFDLRHLRYLTYHPNAEGLANLEKMLVGRMQTLLRS